MARRRMIDPNFWHSEDVSKLSVFERLLFIGMFSNADDYGKGRANVNYLKSVIFPYDDIRAVDVEKALFNISHNTSVVLYEQAGNSYYLFVNWKEWQTVDRPTKSKIPDPDNTTREQLANDSRMTREQLANDSRLKEKKRKEEEEKGKEISAGARERVFKPPDAGEVSAFCAEKEYRFVDPLEFVNFYGSKGWKVGREPMKDWKAAVAGWNARNSKRAPQTGEKNYDAEFD